MWQMLRWLLQWFNKLLKYPLGSRRTQDADGVEGYGVEQPLPELTNADLELLFNELLEGVHQARGQEWAIKYLRRMEPRITVDRWIDWLLIFGERLLSSPAPNTHIATRMVKLGELNVGKVGELASEIGVQLLSREFLSQRSDLITQPQTQEAGEEHYTQQNTNSVEVLVTPQEETVLDTPGQELLRQFGDQLWENEQPAHQPQQPYINPINIPSVSVSVVSWNEVRNGNGSVNLENLDDLNYQQTDTPSEPVVYEFVAEEHPENLQEVQEFTASPLAETPEKSLANLQNLEPQVAQTLDELVARLEQSTSLVQQLASDLALRDRQEITPRPNFQLTVTNQAQQLFYQGLQQARSGDLYGALALYNQAIKLQPQNYEYWFNQGLSLFHLHRFEDAISAYDQTLNLNPDFAKAWYNRGGVLGELGDFDGAVASFEQAIALKPNYHEAWASKGLALLKLGFIWEAISSYEEALQLQPEDQETWYYRGVALGIVEQFEEAIASYNQALEIQPDYYEVLIDRGVVLFSLQRWSEAIESWDQALTIQSDFHLAWYNRGIALENLGKREESIESYQQAINIKPDFHLAWYNQAVALFYLDRLPEAIACYDSALEIKLDYWEAWLGRALAVGKVINTKESLSISSKIATENPALNRRGYEGKIATYQTGLQYLRPDTHPEGWGRLHLALGNTHYEHGKKQDIPRDFWQQAVSDYQQALLTLTLEDFTELHLEVLQSFTKVLLSLRETAAAQELQQQGLYLLEQLLNQNTRSEQSKKQLALKFIGFKQLGVDIAIESGDLLEAWEIAEHHKNTSLELLLSGWETEIYSPEYADVQQLLDPQTAIIYWHLSPAALHTFIIKHQAPSPLSLLTPIQDVETIPESVQRLLDFEKWLEYWQKQYQEHSQIQDLENPENILNNSWCADMEGRLLNLREILNIDTITQELEGIENLILIPHRDLNKLPLHSLFVGSETQVNYTINYLPSIKIGLKIRNSGLLNWQDQKLLSVENIESAENQEIKADDFAAAVIRKMFNNSQHLHSEQVNLDNIKNALVADYNIFHFTGNVINNLREITTSALVLANQENLKLGEISQINVSNYHLFTFPQTEKVNHNIPNINGEYVGIETGLLNTGVANILTTLWKVEPSATAIVMIEFYRRLISLQSPVHALAETIHWLPEMTVVELIKWYEDLLATLPTEDLKLRSYITMQIDNCRKLSEHKKLYSHPYYWAAFILIGDK
jgi:tetratricopeptide (TPR) repeat protein